MTVTSSTYPKVGCLSYTLPSNISCQYSFCYFTIRTSVLSYLESPVILLIAQVCRDTVHLPADDADLPGSSQSARLMEDEDIEHNLQLREDCEPANRDKVFLVEQSSLLNDVSV